MCSKAILLARDIIPTSHGQVLAEMYLEPFQDKSGNTLYTNKPVDKMRDAAVANLRRVWRPNKGVETRRGDHHERHGRSKVGFQGSPIAGRRILMSTPDKLLSED